MPRTYAELREALLLREESFASFLYLDTRGFLTSGLGYLLVRDAPDAAPGAAIQMRALSLMDTVGVPFTPAHRATCDALVAAMNALPAAYAYPSFANLKLFSASPLGEALRGKLELSFSKTDSGALTFKVESAFSGGQRLPVEPLFADRGLHSAYFAQFVTTYEAGIDNALRINPGVTLSDSQRVGLFSAVWNRPKVASDAIAALAANASFDELLGVMSARRPVAKDRVQLETELLTGRTEAEDAIPA